VFKTVDSKSDKNSFVLLIAWIEKLAVDGSKSDKNSIQAGFSSIALSMLLKDSKLSVGKVSNQEEVLSVAVVAGDSFSMGKVSNELLKSLLVGNAPFLSAGKELNNAVKLELGGVSGLSFDGDENASKDAIKSLADG
jgi:hypothetical protein